MSITYTPTTNFGAKDSLPANDPAKVIKGAEFTTEYTAIQSAFALAAPSANPTFTGTASFADVNITNDLTVDTDTLVVDSTNNKVGIGTDSPFGPLDVKAATDVHIGIDDQGSDALLYTATDAAATAAVPLKFQANSFKFSGSSEFMRIDSSGNVGIGTSNPTYDLTVEDGKASIAIQSTNASEKSELLLFNTTDNLYCRVENDGSDFTVQPQGAERFRVTSSGNVGIGTDSPTAILDVAGSNTLGIAYTGSTNGYIRADASAGQAGFSLSVGGVQKATMTYDDTDELKVTSSSTTRFITGVTECVRIAADGNVGIGTDSPVRKLTVFDAADSRMEIRTGTNTNLTALDFSDSDNTARGKVVYDHSDDSLSLETLSTERMRIDASGNVGIGTDSPSKALAVSDGGGFGVELSPDDAGGGYNRILNYDRVNNVYVPTRYEGSTHKFVSGTAGTVDALDIDASGNVGIGTSSPDDELHINTAGANVNLRLTRDTDTGGRITGSDGAGVPVVKFDTIASGVVTERMRIDSSGNVGIGETSPTAERLCLTGASSSTSGIRMRRTDVGTGTGSDAFINISDSGELSIYRGSEGGAGATRHIRLNAAATDGAIVFNTSGVTGEDMRLDSVGRLLIGKSAADGTVTPGIELRNDGVLYASYSGANPCGYFNRGSNGSGLVFRVGNIDAGGVTFTQNGTPAFFSASDERLKDNIVDHESELANVMALRPTRWDWKDEAKGSGEGFIAQELEQTAWADLVRDGDDGYKVVDGLGAVETRLIKALQEAVGRIESLEAEVEALKNA